MARRRPEIDLRVTTGRYASIQRYSLRERLNGINNAEKDVMDLAPEVQLLRALVVDYVEDYDRIKQALLAWHAELADGKAGRPPERLPDLMDVQKLIDSVGKLTSRMHAINQTGMISMTVFRRAVELMGLAVSTYVSDPATLSKIQAAWEGIALDPKQRKNEAFIDAEVVENDHAVE
jgi:hypothetical protein